MPFIPSPNYGWSLTPVYNNKRKLEEEDVSMNIESQEFSAPSKRPCHIPESHHMQQPEINHNSGFPNLNNNNNNVDSEVHDIHGCMKDIVIPHSQYLLTNTPESQSLPSSQNDMIMDLCDETYSNAQLEFDAGVESMDNDYVPDSSQYRQQQPLQQQQPKQQQEPSCNNCVGERSPDASRIRCYCKPTWDSMMDLHPYLSDYY